MRSQIIQGQEIDNADELVAEFDQRLEELKDEDFDKIKLKNTTDVSHLTATQGIPDFWLTAFKNSNMLGVMIEKKDEEFLKELKDIEYVPQVGSHDFLLKFHFNNIVTKRYIMEDQDKVKQINCSKVTLPAPKKSKKKKKGKKAQDEDYEESFLKFFSSKEALKGDPDKDDLDSEDEMRLDEMEEDYDIAVEIRDEIIPNALEYYLNIAEEPKIEEAEGEEDDLPDGEQVQDGKAVDNGSDKSVDD